MNNEIKAELREKGYAIIPNLLADYECESMINNCWNYLENATSLMKRPMKRDDESTWPTYYNLYPTRGMIMKHYGIGHSQLVWDVRQNEKIIDVFSKLWRTPPEELLVSFDGASFAPPPEITHRGYYRSDWFHFDQSTRRPGLECVQSWVTALDVTKGDATLSVLEGSHKYFPSFTPAKESNKDWVKLQGHEVAWFQARGCKQVDIECPAGSLVLWDSRTAHMGKQPTKQRRNPNIRCVVYVCYTPRSKATPKDVRRKIDMFENLRTTNHWPHRPIVVSKEPNTYGNPKFPVKECRLPYLDDIAYKLAGY